MKRFFGRFLQRCQVQNVLQTIVDKYTISWKIQDFCAFFSVLREYLIFLATSRHVIYKEGVWMHYIHKEGVWMHYIHKEGVWMHYLTLGRIYVQGVKVVKQRGCSPISVKMTKKATY